MLGKNLITAAAGAGAAGAVLGIEDVFSTWLYTGNGSTQTITNGIDLDDEGGMVWLKRRDFSGSPKLYDTSRGATKALRSDAANAESTEVNTLTSFNSDGFSIGTDFSTNTATYTSWTFRKAPGFFDVVTYTGNSTGFGSNSNVINHSLGSTPGFIVVKNISQGGTNWYAYHRTLAINSEWLYFNATLAKQTGSEYFKAVDSSTFTMGSEPAINNNGDTYVAYLFAHDEQIFGEGGDQSVIKCGTFTTDGSGYATVDLGWEPQWLLCKGSSFTGNWELVDTMRGFTQNNLGAGAVNNARLFPNLSDAESGFPTFGITSTGFLTGANLGASRTFIYIAIRRGPMKTPTSGTEVFSTYAVNGDNAQTSGFTADACFWAARPGSTYNYVAASRITGSSTLQTASTGAENTTYMAGTVWATNNGMNQRGIFSGVTATTSNFFRRAPGFFDVVAYTGTGVARTVSHNLGVAPELMIFKRRDSAAGWPVYAASLGNNSQLLLNTTNANISPVSTWNYTSPTNTVFTLNINSANNGAGGTYIAYLFATCPGVSKVGSYTGTGTTLSIDCGFTAGARFVLIKRTDSTGDWYVWDTARGIVSGNDPYLLLNSTAAEVTSTDYIDPLSSGFQISSSAPTAINASGGSFIFLAIA